MLSLLLLAQATAQDPLPRQWAQFSRHGMLSHVTETVDIATGEKTGTEFVYKLRLTKIAIRGVPEVRWADSATCPAIPAVVASMQGIKMPSPAPYGVPGETISVIADGVGYSLTAPSSDSMGKLTISSNIGSPLAAWVDGSLEKLESCWQTANS